MSTVKPSETHLETTRTPPGLSRVLDLTELETSSQQQHCGIVQRGMTCAELPARMHFFMKSTNKLGFTLIELSIVLVILGLIIGTIAPLIVSLTKKNKLTDGRQVVATARDEIKGEIARTFIIPTNLNNIGHTIDPWQTSLVYIPAPNLAGQDLCIWLAGGTNQTGLAVCLDGDCAGKKKGNIAFIIASISSNFNRQLENPVNHDGDGADREVRMYSYGTVSDQYTVGPDPNRPTDQFDDIIQYVSVSELVQLISCSVSITNQSDQTVCTGGAAVANNVDLSIIQYNQFLSIGATTDNCITINNSCQITYNSAKAADSSKNGKVKITSAPPACTLQNM